MATQKGRNWSSGDIVTAANLQSIERGVSAVAEEYTPTTWANGNTVTAAALNKIEQGIANAGGGGSSDFSTAEVTFINNRDAIEQVMCPLANDRKRPCAYTSFYVDPGEPVTITVILYKGAAVFEAEGSYSATGNINEHGEIYGDGTVTLSAYTISA